jgi:hypothetical protein
LPYLQVRLPPIRLGVKDVWQEGEEAQLLGLHLRHLQPWVCLMPDAVLLPGVLVKQLSNLQQQRGVSVNRNMGRMGGW